MTMIFDAFASHATDPDGALVRRAKAVLEGFHKRFGVQKRFREATRGEQLEPLRICVDGLDFVFPKADPNKREPIDSLIKEYLSRSGSLIVFSGTETLEHPWINAEIKWFREIHPDGSVYFALTHGPNPNTLIDFMPPALRESKDGAGPLFFDLRGYYRRSGFLARAYNRIRYPWVHSGHKGERLRRLENSTNQWRSVRDFDEELGRLAARLVSDRSRQELSIEDLERSFELARRQNRRRQWSVALSLIVLLVAVYTGLFLTVGDLAQEQVLRTNRIWSQQADLLREDLSASLIESLAYSVNAIANGNTEDGPRGLVQTLQRLVPTEHFIRESQTLEHLRAVNGEARLKP